MEGYQTVIYFFETSNGPGQITASIPPNTDPEKCGKEIVVKMKDLYKEIKLISFEVITLQ